MAAALTIVESIPIQGQQTSFSLTKAARSSFRFLDIPSLLRDNRLTIVETKQLPQYTYACVSFPWSGLAARDEPPVILISGLQASDAISLTILKIICVAADNIGVQFLWLDKLCICQDEGANSPDKLFQIPHMYDIYAKSKVCLVAPGGMLRLPEIDESTTWIDRAWTLQEALAPEDVRVLFAWTKGPKALAHTGFTMIEEVMPGVGLAPLKGLLECNLKSDLKVMSVKDGAYVGEVEYCKVKLLDSQDTSQFGQRALLGAMDHRETEGRHNAIWRCLITRSTRYKEDMIFSSMGLMGVTINAEDINPGIDYNDEEVTQLLIRYIKAIAANGNRAEWLGIAPSVHPTLGYSGLPALPLARNIGRGFARTGEDIFLQPNMQEDGWWSLKGAPEVVVHENADLSFDAKYHAIRRQDGQFAAKGWAHQLEYPDYLINRCDDTLWIFEIESTGKSFALNVGIKEFYLNGSFGLFRDTHTTLLMLVTEIEPGKYRNQGYAWGLEDVSQNWQTQRFKVGG